VLTFSHGDHRAITEHVSIDGGLHVANAEPGAQRDIAVPLRIKRNIFAHFDLCRISKIRFDVVAEITALVLVNDHEWEGSPYSIQQGAAARFKPAAEALAKALTQEGVIAFAGTLEDNDPSPNNVHITVGSKP
jgi:hypothetical protein